MSAESVDWFTPVAEQQWAPITTSPAQAMDDEVLVEPEMLPTAVTRHLVTIVPDRSAFDRQQARDVILERVRDGGPGDLDAFIVGVLRQILDLDRPDSELAAKCRGIGDALTLLRALR